MTSAKMLPTAPGFDIGNRDDGNAVLFGNIQIRTGINEDASGLGFTQFVRPVVVALVLPALRHLVIHVRSLISKEKVIGIHASRVIAQVENMLFASNFTTIQNPRNPVGALHDETGRPHVERAVSASLLEHWPHPFPTSIRLCKMVLKCCNDIGVRMSVWAAFHALNIKHNFDTCNTQFARL